MTIKQMTDIPLRGQRVLIRQDLNVPIKDGKITSDARILAALPTLKQALAQGAKVMVMSHLGRPKEGQFAAEFSLQPIADYLAALLNQPVPLISDLNGPFEVAQGQLVLLENVRFNQGEKADDEGLAKQYASLCEVFVMDAFGTAHRAQASTCGVAKFAPIACAGPLLSAELAALDKALAQPEKPLVAIVGGAKVSSKLQVLEKLSEICNQIIVGGGIANTFLAASGKPVGKSLYEPELIPQAKALMQQVNIPLPQEVVCAKEFSTQAQASLKSIDEVAADDMILDVGASFSQTLGNIIQEARTIIWNGPIGVFEIQQFAAGTQALARQIASATGFSIAGGGDTLAAVEKYQIADDVSYISTGGGAFLEFVEGKVLPAVAALDQ